MKKVLNQIEEKKAFYPNLRFGDNIESGVWHPKLFFLKIVFTLSFVMAFSTSYSQSALHLDEPFSMPIAGGTEFIGTAFDAVVQPDGKTIVVGSSAIRRFNPDGTLDASFVGPGISNSVIYAVALQSDGKIIIGGAFTFLGQVSANRLARLNTDGTIDNTFGVSSGANNSIHNIVVLPDDKIIIGGDFTTYNGLSRLRIARINANGSSDGTFALSGTGTNASVRAIALQSDGKILVGGSFTNIASFDYDRAVRLEPNGQIDNTFQTSAAQLGANGVVRDIHVQSDGKIILVGEFTHYKGQIRNGIVRVNSDASIDNTFSTGGGFAGGGPAPGGFCITALPNNRYAIGGIFAQYNNTSNVKNLVVINADGSLYRRAMEDFSNGSGNTQLSENTVFFVLPHPDNSVVAGGSFYTYNTKIVTAVARFGPTPIFLPQDPCEITNVEVDYISPCDPSDNTYFAEVTITYDNAPSSGTLNVGNENFPITGSPQSVTLTGLSASNATYFFDVWFSDESSCIVQGNVINAPDPCNINVTENLTPFSQQLGTPSAVQSFTVSGVDLTDDIVVNSPNHYEISSNGVSGWGNNVTFFNLAGTANGTVYVRLNSTSVGNHYGEINIQSGSVSFQVSLVGETTDGTSGLDELNNKTSLSVYPNPTNDQINIEFNEAVEIRIFDAHGNLILTSSPSEKHSLSVAHFAQGVYFIRAGNQTQRFIKQ